MNLSSVSEAEFFSGSSFRKQRDQTDPDYGTRILRRLEKEREREFRVGVEPVIAGCGAHSAHRTDLFENPRKWHVSPVVRRLAPPFASRSVHLSLFLSDSLVLAPSRAPKSRSLARSLLYPRARLTCVSPAPPTPRLCRGGLGILAASFPEPRSQFSVLSRAPI